MQKQEGRTVVEKVDIVIHWIITIQWKTQIVFVLLIHRTAIYPVDSAIQLLINRGQEVIIKNSNLLFHLH